MVRRFFNHYGNILFGFRFWAGVLCVFLLFQLDAELPLFFDGHRWSVLRETADFKGILASSLIYGMYMCMLCIAASVGFAMRFHEEWRAGIVPQMVKKMGLRKYTVLYTSLAAVSGGNISAAGFLFYAAYMGTHVKLLNQDSAGQQTQELFYSFTLRDYTGLQYVAVMALLMFLAGALAAIFAICVSTVSENKYLVIVSPYLLYRVYVEVCKMIKLPGQFRLDFYLFGRRDMGNSMPEFVLIVCFLLTAGVAAGQYQFRRGVRKRLAYGKY